MTRNYLQGLKQTDGADGAKATDQENEWYLPEGPVILSPDRLFESFKREVIERRPFEFKVAALRDIRSLFPNAHNPFYAGFGNRDTDHQAYVHVGIPESRVFLINAKGEIRIMLNNAFQKTYSQLSELVDVMFPHGDDDQGAEE